MRRRWVRLLVAVVAVVLVLAALTARLFVWPATRTPSRVDAVVVFAGGDGERQQEGVRLVRAGVAPVLVLSYVGQPTSPRYQVCRQPAGFQVVCFDPHRDDTRAEARAFSDLARTHGWRSLVVVTSSYHLRRASLLLGRCYDGGVFTVATPLHDNRPWEPPLQIAHEWAGLLAALTIHRGC